HTGNLWIETGTDVGTILATVTFTNETASGWQEQAMSSPVTITANQNYSVSYSANMSAPYVYTLNQLPPTITNSPLTALSGCYHQNGTGIFPEARINNHYFADVRFTTALAIFTTQALTGSGTA